MSYFNLIKLDATASTNEYLRERRLKGSSKEGDLVWTTRQTAGRGQGNNEWVAEAGKSLAMSIYRTFDAYSATQAFALNTAFSTALVRGLSQLGIPELRIKWPNDILSGNFKIGGVLIENILKNDKLVSSILGFGLNINQENFSNLPHAASIFSVTQKRWPIEQVLEVLCSALEKEPFIEVLTHADQNLAAYNTCLWRKGKSTKFINQKGDFYATILGVNRYGKLKIVDKEDNKAELTLSEARLSYLQG